VGAVPRIRLKGVVVIGRRPQGAVGIAGRPERRTGAAAGAGVRIVRGLKVDAAAGTPGLCNLALRTEAP
jgi:hypothetical protein